MDSELMNIFTLFHERYIFNRRIKVLAKHLSNLIPENAHVLDIGCGDGTLDRELTKLRIDLKIKGIDTLLRPKTVIPVSIFDGKNLPFPDNAFNGALLIDVLHHAQNPVALLAEAS